MSVDNLLATLRKVKKTGPDKWIACCPSHEDKSPSMSIKDSNGTVLVHCFAGCGLMDILGAVGLEPSEMFPPNDGTWKPDENGRVHQVKFTAMDALRCLSHEGGLLAIYASDMADGRCLGPKERDRLYVACERISSSLAYLESN